MRRRFIYEILWFALACVVVCYKLFSRKHYAWLNIFDADNRDTFTYLFYIILMSLIVWVLIRFWILPRLAGTISERFYAGNYVPEDDPLAHIVQRITDERSKDLFPELDRIVHEDPRRVRAWLEYARLTENIKSDYRGALEILLEGTRAVRGNEDAALLLWRAATLCEKYDQLKPRAPELYQQLISDYPDTGYGRLAADKKR